MKTITVTIAQDGSAKVETKGFAGSACQAGSEFLEQALGVKQSENLTTEFYTQQPTQQALREGRPI